MEWLGWQDREEKFASLMQADLFALTSYNENFGNVVIEALHAGTPVLVSEKTGLSDFVSEFNLGWICKASVEDIVIKLQEIINDKSRRDDISKRAPKLVSKAFSEEKLVPDYVKQYQL